MTPRTILIDHSWLRKASDGNLPQCEVATLERIRGGVADGRFRFVASLLHLQEIYAHGDRESNEREASLIDSLAPTWIRFRSWLVQQELLDAFHTWKGQGHLVKPLDPFVPSPFGYIGDAPPSTEQDTALGFLKWVWSDHAKDAVLQRAANYTVLMKMACMSVAAHPETLLPFIKRKAYKQALEELPQIDRQGNAISQTERERFAEQFAPSHAPTACVEHAFMRALVRRSTEEQVEQSEVFDAMYADSALPHLDVVVLDKRCVEMSQQARRDCPKMRAECFSHPHEALDYLESLPTHE